MRSVQGKIALPMSETKLTKVKILQAVSFIFCFNDFFFSFREAVFRVIVRNL